MRIQNFVIHLGLPPPPPLQQSNYADIRIEAWVDSNRLMLHVPSNLYLLFDTTTYSLEVIPLEGKLDGYFGRHFSFTPDGKTWAVSLGNTGNNTEIPSYSDVMVDTFPNISDKKIDKAEWAEIQLPDISPDGKKLLYEGFRGQRGRTAFLWDGISITEVGVNVVWKSWLDDTQVIYKTSIYEDQTKRYQSTMYLYDIENKTSTPLYSGPFR